MSVIIQFAPNHTLSISDGKLEQVVKTWQDARRKGGYVVFADSQIYYNPDQVRMIYEED